MPQFLSPSRRDSPRGGWTGSSELTDLDRMPWGQATMRQIIDAPLGSGERLLLRLACAALAFLILSQKIAFPMIIEVGFYSTYALVMVLVVRNVGVIDPVRMIGYVAVMTTCVLVTLLSPLHPSFSVNAVVFLVFIHLPFIIVVNVRRTFYLKMIRCLQWIGIIVATFVYLQWLQQFAGMKMLSLEDFVPGGFIFPGFNYIQKIDYFSKYYKPNGFFMMETSNASQLLAITVVVELCLFRRISTLAYLFIAQLATLGGTGMVMTLAALPFVLRYVGIKLVVAGIVVLPLALGMAAYTGVLDNAINRSSEFSKPNTSGNGRFVNHFVVAAKSASVDSDHALFGIGAGNVSPFHTDLTTVFLPLTKLSIEYGIPAALLFTAWMTYCLFTAGVPLIITWPVFMLFNMLGGALLIPVNTYYGLLLSSLFVPNRAVGMIRSGRLRRDCPPRSAVRDRPHSS